MIQNSCELETELGTRQVFVATRQSKASQGKSRQVKASQGKSTSLQNRLLEVRVIVRVFGLQQVEKDVNKIQQQLRYCQQTQEQSRNVKKVFWTVLKVARRVLHICCLLTLTPPSSLPIATAATAHCDPLDECAECCRTTTPTTNESRTYCSFILG